MKTFVWFLMGGFCTYQAAVCFPTQKGFSYILSQSILEPLTFLEGAVFIFAAFVIFSFSILRAMQVILYWWREKRKSALFYGMIGVTLVLIIWGILFLMSPYISLIVYSLTLIYLALSKERLKREKSKAQ
ncbi:hypothetical protein [Tuberibacillus calidus]|uniref:hypothetical protein n=1 Tax=Tuberibacillus calidus TaxID=340097 RepID=UPI00040764B8|nr:hypothetical protein [Tuberibacillus calidus]